MCVCVCVCVCVWLLKNNCGYYCYLLHMTASGWMQHKVNLL